MSANASLPNSPPAASDRTLPQGALAVVGLLVFVELCSGILQGSVPTLVPLIGTQMHIGSGDLSWINTLPLLVAGISVPLASKLGDIYGHRRMLLITMACVAVGSVIAALATSYALLLVGRALQGLFIAWLPFDIAIVRDRIRGRRVGSALGLLVGAIGLGSTIGSIGVGLLSEHIHSTHALLWFPAIAVLLCLPIVLFFIPETVTRLRSRIDWLGALLLSAGLGCGLLALGNGQTWGWNSARVLALGAIAVAALVLFAAAELRGGQPFIDVRMVASRRLAPLYLLSFIGGAATFGATTAGATFLATPSIFGFGFGMNTLDLALMALPVTAAGFAAAGSAARLMRSLGARTTLSLGFLLFTAAYGLLTVAHAALWQLVVAFILTGLGLGLLIGALPVLITDRLPADQVSTGIGVYETLRAVAGSVAGAAFGAILNANLLRLRIPGVKLADLHGYVLIWTSCTAVCVVGFLTTVMLGRTSASLANADQGARAGAATFAQGGGAA